MAVEERQRERDLILSPNEFAFISDQTKGNINIYVGPYKASLSNTDQPIIFNEKSKRFEKCSLEGAIQTFAISPEGWYLVLKNPAKDNSNPKTGTVNSLTELNVGHKVNIPGPISFPLWSGQMVNVVKGHHLRSNQYLVVRVYDETAAKDNWNKAVIKKSESSTGEQEFDVSKLKLGKHITIKGTEVSFYIPPTGIEVVKDAKNQYIREAVTLERLEYCILLDEDGNKRYVRGPEVVFPEPTETFIQKDGSRKYRAIELSEIKGIYIKVIAPYSEAGKDYKEGDELFITGKDQMIYFPRKEHAIVKYEDDEVHYAVAIPLGEARYVMNRLTGEVKLRRGPDMFLPDPRFEVIVRRILEQRQVSLWFPGNDRAIEINSVLRQKAIQADKPSATALPQNAPSPSKSGFSITDELLAKASLEEEEKEQIASDSFQRRNKYTPPRYITLDTKYDGAVSIGVWAGYAIMVVGKSGERKVIVGPSTYLLEFDEDMQVFSLSKGNPKSDENLVRDVYLRVANNKVSDTIDVESKDFVSIQIKLSYRLNFVNDSSKWFNVENYVKFLTDRFRSVIRTAVKNFRVEEFYTNGINIIKKTILGEDNAGYHFTENEMKVYDVEVTGILNKDATIAKLMQESQQALIQESTTLTREKSKLEILKFMETVKRETSESQYITQKAVYGYEKEELEKRLELETTRAKSNAAIEELKLNNQRGKEELMNQINALQLTRDKSRLDQEVFFKEQNINLSAKELETQVKAMVERAKAISPDFIAALQSFNDKEQLVKIAEAMAPLAILGGESVAEVFSRLLSGTKLEGVFLNIGTETLGKLPIKKKDTDKS